MYLWLRFYTVYCVFRYEKRSHQQYKNVMLEMMLMTKLSHHRTILYDNVSYSHSHSLHPELFPFVSSSTNPLSCYKSAFIADASPADQAFLQHLLYQDLYPHVFSFQVDEEEIILMTRKKLLLFPNYQRNLNFLLLHFVQ